MEGVLAMYTKLQRNLRKARKAASEKKFNCTLFNKPKLNTPDIKLNRKQKREIWMKARGSYSNRIEWRNAWMKDFVATDVIV